MIGDKFFFINHTSFLNIVIQGSDRFTSPTEVKTLRVHAKALYPTIDTVDTSTLDLPIEFENVLKIGLKAELADTTGDLKTSVFYEQKFDRKLKDMVAEVSRGKKLRHTMKNYDL